MSYKNRKSKKCDHLCDAGSDPALSSDYKLETAGGGEEEPRGGPHKFTLRCVL